jgi:hypothetical protein
MRRRVRVPFDVIPTPLRWVDSRTPERRIEWRVSRRTHQRFRELLHELLDTEYESQSDPEVQARMEMLREEIRALPGYPKRYHPERDLIVPVVTTEQA